MAIDNFLPSSIWDFPAETTNEETQSQEAAMKEQNQSEVFYKTKKIYYRGQTKLIILQNHNGPCPLIAICNVLLLRDEINLHPNSFQVSQETLLNLVCETLTDPNNYEVYDVNLQSKISDAIELLPSFANGISVDIRFSRIDDFVFTPQLAIFELLKIGLYHGWLTDPQDLETTTAIGGKTHDALLTGLIALDTQTQKASSVQSSEERYVLGVPSKLYSKTVSFADDSSLASFGKGDIEEEIAWLNILTLSQRETRAFGTPRDSVEGESVSGFSDEYQISEEDDTLVTSEEISEDETDSDFGKKVNVGEEVCSTTSITKSNETHDYGQISSAELEMGDGKVCDVETEYISKISDVTSSEAPKSVEKTSLESTKTDIISSTTSITKSNETHDYGQLPSSKLEMGDEKVCDGETENISKIMDATSSEEKTNLESTKSDVISETPLTSEAETFVHPDLSGKDQEDDVALYEFEECVSLGSPFYEEESFLGQSSSKGKDTNGLTPEEGEVIRKFLNDNATQLTWQGLVTLSEDLEENELCVLFRNNHFYTMLKRDEKLYTLVTDQGYLMEQDLVWERLNEINGDSVFMTGHFRIFKSNKSFKSQKWDQQNAISNTADFIFNVNSSSNEDMDIDPDLKLAMELQQQALAEETGFRGFSYKKQPPDVYFNTRSESSPKMIKAVQSCI